MLFIRSTFSDPSFNLAAEEFLLKNFTDDIYFQYVDQPSVIVGKHQNSLAEINYRFLKTHQILFVRRLTGGGTVYHDDGNINFSFIMNGREGSLVDFKKFLAPITSCLHEIGVPAVRSERNDLLIGDYKFSGNAEHVYRKRTLHHGTLLYNASLHKLGEALHPVGIYTDRAVKSKRSPVTNISDHIPAPVSTKVFSDLIFEGVRKNFADTLPYTFGLSELESISQLAEKKYATWEWNIAYSPDYTMKKACLMGENPIRINLSVSKGIIQEVKLETDTPHKLPVEAAKRIQGNPLREESLLHALEGLAFTEKENQVLQDLVLDLF